MIEEYQERRRFALLQAAATIYHNEGLEPCSSGHPQNEPELIGWCINEAEAMLAEIERRENVTPPGAQT